MSEAGPIARATAPRETLELVHHHPGRLRVRAGAFRGGGPVSHARARPEGRDAPADRARAALEGLPGITAAAHNAHTGSLLVEYQPGLADPEAILATIGAAAELDLPPEEDRLRRREPALVAIEVSRELNSAVHELTGHRVDLRSMVPAGMLALAGYSLFAHKESRLPRWDNLLYWSYNIFTQLHRREIEGGRAEPVSVDVRGSGSASGPAPRAPVDVRGSGSASGPAPRAPVDPPSSEAAASGPQTAPSALTPRTKP